MVRILSVASLALAVVSAVSGHIIRHRSPPQGWETPILESYDVYHARYLEFKCYEKHNTDYFDQCCHPLLKDQSTAVLHDRQCYPTDDGYDGYDCDDGDSSSPSYTPAPEHNTPAPSPPAYSPEPSTSTSSSPAHTTSPAAQPKVAKPDAPEPSSTPETTHTKAASPSPSPSPSKDNNDDGDFNFGGFATFFYQKGNAGACGKVHSDDDLIAAMDERRYGTSGNASPLCGKKVEITNTDNGKSVVVIVADDCPTCTNSNSIDLSTGAFKQIADFDKGLVPIKWQFVS